MIADDETYFRSMSAFVYNLKMSAWMSSDYAILPFWPTNIENMPLGATLARTAKTWESTTTVFEVNLECSPMLLAAVGSFISSDLVPDYSANLSYSSMKLQFEDGCIYDVAWRDNWYGGFWNVSGGAWEHLLGKSNLSTNPGGIIQHPNWFANSSSECGSRDLFFVSSSYSNVSTRTKGEICSTSYYMAGITTTVSITGSVSQINFDPDTFDNSKRLIDCAFLNIPLIEAIQERHGVVKIRTPPCRQTRPLPPSYT